MGSLKDMMKKSGGKYHPGTSVKFKQNAKGKVSPKSMKGAKFPMGSKVNLK